ncbi:AMP-binding protein [Actinomarinicola tropica]|uniref:AMP-binding protein n=1 Tax=Actinomarinicola tropica TaxID=2789776 RepID=A0A5Q2RK32_9ACTN|nr:AMP-binding protein [Actinomarinicola tropica]
MVDAVGTLTAVARTGLLNPVRPDRFVRMARALRERGPTTAGLVAAAAARHPDRTAVVDERGTLTWAELDHRTNALAHGLARIGVDAGSTVGVLCRNHRGFVESVVAASKLGADVVLLNTGFAAPQLAEVVAREGVTALAHDASFDDVVDAAGLAATPRAVAWTSADAAPPDGTPTFDDLVAAGPSTPPAPPAAPGEVTILSSGTTGTPKGARRSTARAGSRSGAGSQAGVLTKVPLRSGDPTLVSAPLFHTWGLSGFITAALMASPMVLRERFDPEDALAAIDRHGVGTFVAVPVMLQRILELPLDRRVRYDTGSLRVVFLSGSALPGGLAHRWMDAFGENLYSLYGSTEVAAVALAGPSELRAHADTAGPVLPGIEVRLLDDRDHDVPAGASGRIFVRSGMAFEGYTGGGTKQVVDGYMSTGDVGRIAGGHLYVEGREDDMIISGGENVVPSEVEEVLLRHDEVVDAAVVGVPDPEFGQRLAAHVVLVDGASADHEALRGWVRENLANYKVPREVVVHDRLPRNPTGKVLRRQLLDPAADSPRED